MKISELAVTADVALSAVKYYQREGLLPAGEKTAPNQVSYGDEHVRRVRLVRALLETGGLSIATTREVIAAVDGSADLADTFAVAQHALTSSRPTDAEPSDKSRTRVESLAASRGWRLSSDNPGFALAARALDGYAAIGFDAPEEYLDAYADAAQTAARADLVALTTRREPDAIAELMVVGTVLGDPLFAGLRRLAQQDATHEHFPVDPER